MKGSPLYSRVYDTDMRISINYENRINFEAIKNHRVKHERIKHRRSFRVGWTRIDLTRVEADGLFDFEVELEIIDVNHFLNNRGDIIILRKLVRKFLLNQIYISKVTAHLVHMARANQQAANKT